jgi:signal transduction histidine kinase
MQQVLLNLITNANKFQSNKDIKIYCFPKEEPLALEFRVEDQGIGILEKDI